MKRLKIYIIVVLIVCLVFSIGYQVAYNLSQRYADWGRAEARITDVEQTSRRVSKRRNGKRKTYTEYKYHIEYEYEVNGQIYTDKHTSDSSKSVGDTKTIIYNPDDISDSRWNYLIPSNFSLVNYLIILSVIEGMAIICLLLNKF